MNDLDDILQQALDPETAGGRSADYTIRNQFGEIADSFRGRSKMISLFWICDVLVLTGLGVTAAVFMFRADDVRMTVIWATAVMGLGLTIGLTKLWFYMLLNRNRVVREIKRLELGLTLLHERLGETPGG